MRKYSELEKEIIRYINEENLPISDLRLLTNFLDEHMTEMGLIVDFDSKSIVIEHAGALDSGVEIETIISKSRELEKLLFVSFSLVDRLIKSRLVFAHSNYIDPAGEKLFGPIVRHDTNIRYPLKADNLKELIFKYVLNPLSGAPDLADLEKHNFRSHHDRKFDKQIKIGRDSVETARHGVYVALAGVFIALGASIWTNISIKKDIDYTEAIQIISTNLEKTTKELNGIAESIQSHEENLNSIITESASPLVEQLDQVIVELKSSHDSLKNN